MRYISGLIPERSKVLPDYFKGNAYKREAKKPVRDVFLWLAGIFLLLMALAMLIHPLLALPLSVAALVLIPPGARFIEKLLQFRFTSFLKYAAAAALFVVSMPLAGYYNAADEKAAHEEALVRAKEEQVKALTVQKEKLRKDSLEYYIQHAIQLRKAGNIKGAREHVTNAWSFAGAPEDTNRINQEERAVCLAEALNVLKAGNYAAALSQIDTLLAYEPENVDLLYHRAVCYSKTGNVKEAVTDLRKLIARGIEDAQTLYDKVNPVRKRVSGYCTRCWDGSTSSATGRGACSHHGGVKNWNEPIYEEYRQYE